MMKRRFVACCLIFLFGCVSSKLLYKLIQSCSLPVACMLMMKFSENAGCVQCWLLSQAHTAALPFQEHAKTPDCCKLILTVSYMYAQ